MQKYHVKLLKGDITKLKVDAIVNAANNSLLGGGGVDGAIHRAAGPELVKECATLNGCKTGSAKITSAYNLPCRWVIHAVGPIWWGGNMGERELLSSCYSTSMRLAIANNAKSIAFPLISSGVYGYPKKAAVQVALATLEEFADCGVEMYLVLYDEETYRLALSCLE